MQGARAPQPGATNRPSPSGPLKGPLRSRPFSSETFLKRCAAPRAPCERHPRPSSPRRNAPRGPAALAAGAHPDPYRTRKLSRPAPRVLQGRPCGRAGRRRPSGRVARARGGEARTGATGRGGAERAPLFVCGAFPPAAKKQRRRQAHAGLSAAFCVQAQAALGARHPMGPSARLIGAGAPSDVAPFKRRRADSVGRLRARLSSGRPGLCIWGRPARIPYDDFSHRRRAGVPCRARTALYGRCAKAAGKPRGLAGGLLRALFVLAWFSGRGP